MRPGTPISRLAVCVTLAGRGEKRSRAIKRLEVTDLNFELVFLECIRQDQSGEKGFEALDQNFVFQVERESPQSFPQK
jgi:hypothetical protein